MPNLKAKNKNRILQIACKPKTQKPNPNYASAFVAMTPIQITRLFTVSFERLAAREKGLTLERPDCRIFSPNSI
jgi:hypothetical protein